MFTEGEMAARHSSIQHILNINNLKALLLLGDSSVGFGFCGDLRYFTDHRMIFHRQMAVVFPDSEPVLFTGSEISNQHAARRSFIKDCRLSENIIEGVTKLLKERGILTGRIGVNFEMLPVAWFNHLKHELQHIEWVETHDSIMQVRFQRSQEEADIYRKGAVLGDSGFKAALQIIKPGISEYEIAAEIEYYARQRGAEEHFTLIASGKFAFGDNNTLPLVYAPSERRINIGDSIMLEITPRYGGYWTQLVRTVNVGEPNNDLQKIYEVCREAIKKGLDKFRPGYAIRDVALAMNSYVTECGYLLRPPLGHFCGVDLVEARISLQNNVVLKPGMAVIIHPTVHTADGKNCFFWGETYLIIDEGYERLHHVGDELITV